MMTRIEPQDSLGEQLLSVILYAQQLYLLQYRYHILDQIQERMMTRIEPQDSLGELLLFVVWYVQQL
jgi:hypothetical protein